MRPMIYVKGASFAHLTILRRGEDGYEFTVRCTCGRAFECTQATLYLAKAGKQTSCLGCRWKIHRTIVQCVHCERVIERPSNHKGHAACDACCNEVSRIASRRCGKARSRAIAGRVCVGCARTDAETNWGGRTRCCGACDRLGERNGWAPCGAPLWIGGGGRNANDPQCRKHRGPCPDESTSPEGQKETA